MRFPGVTSGLLIWHDLQTPAVALVWFQLAGNQALERWQLSQDFVALFPVLCVEGFANDKRPLWQVVHCPGCALPWLNRAPSQVALLKWQLSQGASVTMCEFDLGVAMMRLPVTWQPSHVRGVPLKTPPMWQVSHAATACPPDSGKPVVM